MITLSPHTQHDLMWMLFGGLVAWTLEAIVFGITLYRRRRREHIL